MVKFGKVCYEHELKYVSIIVATYRRDKVLKRALLSLLKQTYKNIEIILVDDNADDYWNRTVIDIVEEIKLQFNFDVVYIKNSENYGSAKTRNIGISVAKGEYITFLDDDDIYLPNKVSNQLEEMIKCEADYSLTDLYLYNEGDKLVDRRDRNYIKDFSLDSLKKYNLLYHMTGTDSMMFKKNYILSFGGFPPIDIGDEFYLMNKAIEHGGKFCYIATCDIRAYIHTDTDGLSSGEGKIKGENELYEYKKKYFDKLGLKEVRYIKMRHFAVLAFAELRRKEILLFIKYSLKSFINSPFQCLHLLYYRSK